MRKAYKFRLSPNKQQEEKLFWTLHRCQELYNAALSERKDAYRMAGKSISYYEQKRDLPEIKEIRPEYHDIHSQVLQDVLLRLKRAFDPSLWKTSRPSICPGDQNPNKAKQLGSTCPMGRLPKAD
jgi:putative transposase